MAFRIPREGVWRIQTQISRQMAPLYTRYFAGTSPVKLSQEQRSDIRIIPPFYKHHTLARYSRVKSPKGSRCFAHYYDADRVRASLIYGDSTYNTVRKSPHFSSTET